MTKLPNPKEFVDKNQPPLIYDIKSPWEKVVKAPPVWKSGKFPPLPKEKKYSFLGKKLISPIVVSAGSASGHFWTDFYLKMGFGAVIEKTRRTSHRPSNKVPNIAIIHSTKLSKKSLGKPVIASLDPDDFNKYKSVTNSFGNPSPQMSVWGPELKRQKKAVGEGQMLGCSVTATIKGSTDMKGVVEDLLKAAKMAVKNGADFVEFNLACPNVIENSEEGEMFQDEDLVKCLFSEFKKRFPKTPTGFKFGLYKSKKQMRTVLKAAGKNLDYLSGINAVSNPVVDKKGKEILPGRGSSGVCGKLLQDIALEAIKWASQIRKEEKLKFQILGGGGVVEIKDVDRYQKAGADIIQVSTISLADPLFAYKYYFSK